MMLMERSLYLFIVIWYDKTVCTYNPAKSWKRVQVSLEDHLC